MASPRIAQSWKWLTTYTGLRSQYCAREFPRLPAMSGSLVFTISACSLLGLWYLLAAGYIALPSTAFYWAWGCGFRLPSRNRCRRGCVALAVGFAHAALAST